MKKRLSVIAFGGMLASLLIWMPATAQQKDKSPTTPATKEEKVVAPPFLGVAVESMPPGVARQVPDLKGRGIIITHVTKDSPAHKAGLKPFDILLSYDDYQLNSPEQLVRLV